MKRVTGIGGIFFKAKDAPALQAWYKRHLGIDVQEWGGTVCAQHGNFHGQLPGGGSPRPGQSLARRRLQRSREDRRFRVREVCLGHRSRRKQGRTLATACRAMTSYRLGSNSSTGFPSGSSSWIWLPAGPVSISFRKRTPALFSFSIQDGRSLTRKTTRFHPPAA